MQTIPIKQILFQATNLLSFPYNIAIQPKIVYTKLKPTFCVLFNFNETINNINLNTINTLPDCQCHLPQFAPYVCIHGHIDTIDLTILQHLSNSLDTAC